MIDRPYPSSGFTPDGFRPSVWAPQAERVELVVPSSNGAAADSAAHPMVRSEDGWWSASGTHLRAGDRYAFSVDGSDPRPDPRSAHQPDGVHGASAATDPDAHRWTDAAWAGIDARDAVIYELHVGTFTEGGTLDSAIERLDHLAELGVGIVELMPLAAFGGSHGWGYDGVALYAVHDPYGGPDAFKRFVDAAHARGMGVCLDVVYNHLGPSGNYLSVYGPYFTDRHETPWGQAVNLDDEGCAEVRAFVIDNAVRWFDEFHVDALRLDAVHALVDDSDVHLLAALATRVEALAVELGRPLSLIAESDRNDPLTVTPVAEGGLGMTAQWADDVHHAVRSCLTGERHGWFADFADADAGGRPAGGAGAAVEKVMTGAFFHDGSHSSFRGTAWGAPVPRDIDPRRFVAFGTTHDQVGNRALGDRPSAVLAPGELAAMAALVLCSAFTPMIFMGEEWGATTPFRFFTDHREPELATAIREGRAREFDEASRDAIYGHHVEVPDPQDPATFEGSRLDWSELAEDPARAALLRWHRRLLALRTSEPALLSRDLDAVSVTRGEDGDGLPWLALYRGDLHLVVTPRGANAPGRDEGESPADDPATTVRVPAAAGEVAEIVLAWDDGATRLESDGTLVLPAGSVALLRAIG